MAQVSILKDFDLTYTVLKRTRISNQ